MHHNHSLEANERAGYLGQNLKKQKALDRELTMILSLKLFSKLEQVEMGDEE